MASRQDVLSGKDTDPGLLATLSGSLGWHKQRPQTESVPKTGRKPWEVRGKMPSKLIRNLEGIYLDLPRVAVAVAYDRVGRKQSCT